MDWIKNISKPRKKDANSSSGTTSLQPLADLLARHGVTEDVAQERLMGVDLANYVVMPTGLDQNEWFASHTVAFFDHLNLIYGCVSDSCQVSCCQSSSSSTLSAGSYQWVDEKGKKTKCNAPQFVENVMLYVQKCVDDEGTFPTKYGNKFPANFESTLRKIHSRLYQVISHLYISHLKDIVNLQLQACLNTVTYHFLVFNRQFHLIDDKDSSDVIEGLFQLLQATARKAPDVSRFGPASSNAAPDPLAPRSLTPPAMLASSPRRASLLQPRHRSERSPASKAFLSQSSRLKSPFKSKENVARDRKGSAPFRPLSIAT